MLAQGYVSVRLGTLLGDVAKVSQINRSKLHLHVTCSLLAEPYLVQWIELGAGRILNYGVRQ